MNNKQLNKEFTQMMKDRTKFNKKGLSSSEDEDDTTNKSLKSPKSARSSVSGRSSLLSARSPRDENMFGAQQKRNMMNTIRPNAPAGGRLNKLSPETSKFSESEDDDSINSPRKDSRLLKEKSLSPKSPRGSDRSVDNSFTRMNNRRNGNEFVKQDDSLIKRNARSPRNNDHDDFNNLNMLSTMRRPLNDSLALTKTLKQADLNDIQKPKNLKQTFKNLSTKSNKFEFDRSDDDEFDERSEGKNNNDMFVKNRTTTPTKLNLTSKNLNTSQRRMQMPSKIENDLVEEDLLNQSSRRNSVRSTRLSSRSHSPKNSPPQSPKSLNRSLSPKDSLNINDDHLDKDIYIKQAKKLDILMNPNTQLTSNEVSLSESTTTATTKTSKKASIDHSEKDPQVVETIEDSKFGDKLQKQRELKRLEREERAKKQTESTKKIEDAIEKVENTMEDSLRLNSLKEKSQELKYPTKPVLNETKVLNTSSINNNSMRQSRSVSAKERKPPARTRSSSASSRFERTFTDKYSYVKPKTQTRPAVQSARTEYELSKHSTSKQDFMNDSSSLREATYNEWYIKKLQMAKEKLKEAQQRQRDEEERKTQDLIEKSQKSRIGYEKWRESKEGWVQSKKEEIVSLMQTKEEKKLKEKEQKRIAEKAFEQWLVIKKEQLKSKKEEENESEIKTEKQKRKDKTKNATNEKPPLPYQIWLHKKEEETKEKLNSVKQKEKEKNEKLREKYEREKLAKQSYNEWLEKKYQEEEVKPSLSRKSSSSMSALPPFYPSSRTIPFGR